MSLKAAPSMHKEQVSGHGLAPSYCCSAGTVPCRLGKPLPVPRCWQGCAAQGVGEGVLVFPEYMSWGWGSPQQLGLGRDGRAGSPGVSSVPWPCWAPGSSSLCPCLQL